MTERKMSPASLENLKMGSIANNRDKIRCNFTLLPETKKWLAASGNASERIDDMVSKWLKGELVGKGKLDEAEAKIKALKEQLGEQKSTGMVESILENWEGKVKESRGKSAGGQPSERYKYVAQLLGELKQALKE
ncbi:hypothetical protein [Nostoc sp.]|uniref:hypothetical protein n=1 Tax=Nostoc sp. TaxID=1180 RepID=UPI002FF85B59